MPRRARSRSTSAMPSWPSAARPGSRAATTISRGPSGAMLRPWGTPKKGLSPIPAARRKPMSMRISSGAEIVAAAPPSLTRLRQGFGGQALPRGPEARSLTRAGAAGPRKGGGREGAARLLHRLLLLLLVGLPLAGCGVNNIPSYSQQAKAAWAQVLNQYQRRADLVPNLVATVKGAANFESKTLEAVVEARAKVGQMQLPPDILTNPQAFQTFQQNQGALTSALSRLMVVVEQYPELKANANFQTLQAQLEGTENRIAVARRDYIEAVRAYNTELRTFPGILWANTFFRGNKPMAEFTAGVGADKPPQVKF